MSAHHSHRSGKPTHGNAPLPAMRPTERWIAGLLWIAEHEPVGWFDAHAPVVPIRNKLLAHGLIEEAGLDDGAVAYRLTGAGRRLLARGIKPEAGPRAQTIVKLTYVSTDHYRVCGPNRSAIQYRQRHGIRGELLDALRHHPSVFVFATVGPGGRWHLGEIAPEQKW